MDIIMGFSSGDLMWYEPISQKYSRLNKNGRMNPCSVVDVRWLPHSESLFVAAHADGALLVYEKDRDDSSTLADVFDAPQIQQQQQQSKKEKAFSSFAVYKSIMSPSLVKTNPIGAWKLGNAKPEAMAFSPDGFYLAVVSEDGTLKIIDMALEK